MIELQVVSLYLLKLWATSSWVLSRWDRTIPRNFEDCRLHCRHLKSLWAFSVFHLKEKHVLWWHLGGGGNRGQPECKRFAGRWRFFNGRVRVVNSCKNVVPSKVLKQRAPAKAATFRIANLGYWWFAHRLSSSCLVWFLTPSRSF